MQKMPDERVSLFYRIKHCFIYHPWLKLISLMLAAIVWSYVNSELLNKKF